MGHVEQLNRYFESTESVSEDELRDQLRTLERNIRESWEKHKQHHAIMHGTEIKDNGLEMVLLWMLRGGLIR